MFVRFILKRRDERSGVDEGIFTVAYRESDGSTLGEWEHQWLKELLAWFRAHVKVPPALKDDKNRRAICWFKEEADEVVSKARELAIFLKERGYHLEIIRTKKPGVVVYEDGHQVAARPLGYDYHEKRANQPPEPTPLTRRGSS